MKKIFILSKDLKFKRSLDGILNKSEYRVEDLYSVNPEELFNYICINQVDFIIVHNSYINGFYRLFDMLIGANKCSIIYVTPNSEEGIVYNAMQSPRFYMISPNNISSLEDIINIMARDITLFEKKEEELRKIKEKQEEERLVKKAKLALMKDGYTEEQAYKYILKKAMDERLSRAEVSKIILQKGAE